MQKVIIDEGSAQIKACWVDNKSVVHEKIIQAAVIEGTKLSAIGNSKHSGSWVIDGVGYTVDEKMANRSPTNVSKIYQFSNANRALTHEILRQIGLEGKKVDVSTTLPIGLYFDSDSINQANIDRKVANTTGAIKHFSEIEPAQIIKSTVYAESISAAFDYLFNESGEQVNEVEQMMIVDIGGTTTDITVVTGDLNIENHQCLKLGVFDVTNKVKNQLLKNTEFDDIPPQAWMR